MKEGMLRVSWLLKVLVDAGAGFEGLFPFLEGALCWALVFSSVLKARFILK